MGIRGEIYSTKVTLENRTYFFNVKENRLGDLYLNIVESKNKETGGFDRQSVVLFADDLQDFLKGFEESLKVMEKEVREKRKPRSDRGERLFREAREEGGREYPDGADREDRDRKPFDRERKPFDRDRKPFDPNRKPSGRDRKPFDPERKPFDRDRKPFDPDRRPFDPNRKPFDPNHKPFDRDRKPFTRGSAGGDDKPFKKFVKSGGGYGGHKKAGALGVKMGPRKARAVRAVRRDEPGED